VQPPAPRKVPATSVSSLTLLSKVLSTKPAVLVPTVLSDSCASLEIRIDALWLTVERVDLRPCPRSHPR
jgi:hypothetical protein